MAEGNRRAVIIGAGLGGLLTGAYLARQGREVTIFEELSLIGGRFTHIDYEGFAVPTGAFHTLPGGRNGPIAECLRLLDIEPELAEPSPSFLVIVGGCTYPVQIGEGQSSGVREAGRLTSSARLALRLAAVTLKNAIGLDTSIADLVRGLSPNDVAVRLFDHLTKFSSGVPAESASVVEILRSLRTQGFGSEGILMHGNRSLITSIAHQAIAHGATLRTGTRVTEIIVQGGRACGIRTEDGEVFEAGIVISNAGAARTFQLLGEAAPTALAIKLKRAVPAHGVAHAIRCGRRMHDHSAVEISLDLDHISGITPISNLCPDLCPEGWSYSLAYQALEAHVPVPEQIKLGIAEIKDHLGSDVEVFNSAVYRGDHPAAYMSQSIGQHGRSRFPSVIPSVADLYLVGQDAAGYGIAAEMIGDSCRRLWRRLK